MKIKLVVSSLFICLVINTYAQIPNAGFENWTLQIGGFEDPDNWTTNNDTVHNSISVSKTADSYTGSFALQVINNWRVFEGPHPGYATIVYTDTNLVSKISAYVKCDSISGTGKGIIKVYGYSGTSNQIIGNWETSIEISQYTLIEIPLSPIINYDSIRIQIIGFAENLPNGMPSGHSMLKVDEMNAEITSDMEEFNINYLKFFPNPFSDYTLLKFENPTYENFTLTIYDASGKLVKLITNIQSGKIMIEKQELSEGIYLLKMQSDATYLGAGIFIVQ